jgi:hypothetical protein
VDDLSRAWAILNLPLGSSEEDARTAYRNLVKEWHPDRFQGDADRLDEAHEMLKEINWAYDHLRATVFTNQATPAVEALSVTKSSPAPTEAQPESEAVVEDAPTGSKSGLLWIVVLLIAAGAVFYFVKTKSKPPTIQSVQTNAVSEPVVAAKTETPSPPRPKPREADPGILKSMVPTNKLKVENSPDGLVLSGDGEREYLQTPWLARPPFVFRATVKTGEADVRFYYGLGQVILNWTDNPQELRVHDFATSAITGVRRKGGLAPNAWHDLGFSVQTNGLTVSVDGETRFEGQGFYRNLNSAPGIGPFGGEITVKSVTIEQAPGADIADTAVRPRVLVPGDLLPTMVTVNNIQTNADLEGLILSDTERKGGAIMTQQKFHPPLIIRTRAKTDALDLRLFYANGMVIFNWELNPTELRVHDPANGRISAIAGKGGILPNQWHDVVWEIARTGVRLFVDGQVRFQASNDYSKLDGAAGIGAYLSKVTVASFVVEQR